jgi:hypothetical protein
LITQLGQPPEMRVGELTALEHPDR